MLRGFPQVTAERDRHSYLLAERSLSVLCGVVVAGGSLAGEGGGEGEFTACGQEVLVATGDDEVGIGDALG